MEASAFAVLLAPYFGTTLLLIFGMFWMLLRSVGRLETRLGVLERSPVVVMGATARAPRLPPPTATKNRPLS